MTTLPPWVIERAVNTALEEDLPWGDLTSAAFIPANARSRLAVRYREPGVVCGLEVARAAFARLEPALAWETQVAEGQWAQAGQVVAVVAGATRQLLQAERVALNFLQRLSGVATLTARYVAAVRAVSASCQVAATRKTTPGLRALEKHAVMLGGGLPHRFSLSDGVLLKDNHVAFMTRQGQDLRQALTQALAQARASLPHGLRVQLEVETLAQAAAALEAGIDLLLLDNMAPAQLREVVALVETQGLRNRVTLEASGGITLATIAAVAQSGVDVISVGALTHSAPALDIGLDDEGA